MVSLLNSAFLGSIETAVNLLIAADPSTLAKLGKLRGSVIKISCRAPRYTVFITIHERGFHLNPYMDIDPDIEIDGSATALAGLLRPGKTAGNFQAGNTDISGDIMKAQTLQRILSESSVDWPYYLSRIIGDIPTQALADTLNSGRKVLTRNARSLIADVDEYLHEEKNLFPGRDELEAFYSGIDNLTQDVDRLAARINHLTSAFGSSQL